MRKIMKKRQKVHKQTNDEKRREEGTKKQKKEREQNSGNDLTFVCLLLSQMFCYVNNVIRKGHLFSLIFWQFL